MSDHLQLTVDDVVKLSDAATADVLASWVKARRTELPEALARCASKVHARLGKKALYQLKSSGLSVVAAPVVEAQALTAPVIEELPGVISPFLGTGERAIFFARPRSGGGVDVYQGILNDTQGLMMLDRGESNRGTYRRRMKELQADAELKVLMVPWSRLRLELARTAALNVISKLAMPTAADQSLRRLDIEPDMTAETLPSPLPDDEALSARGAQLHQEREIGQWLPSEPDLKALALRLDEVKKSPLALSVAQQAEQLESKITALARESTPAEARRIWARRLWFMADLFDASKRADAARVARAEARRLFHLTERSSFLEELFRKAAPSVPTSSPEAPGPERRLITP